jgi:suppressor of G2 allele of SKP1
VSSKPKKNWDKIVEEETKDEKLEGEEALNKVFQDIYANGTDEQKRAMIKSFVLSLYVVAAVLIHAITD